jgi:hypothetical protein
MTDPLESKILFDGLDDWVPRAAIQGAARLLGAATKKDEVARSRESVRALVEAGKVEIGTVTDVGFVPWSGTPDEILRQLDEQWQTKDEFGFWTRNTESGIRAARRTMS